MPVRTIEWRGLARNRRQVVEQLRSVAAAVATPLLPEDYVDLLAPLHGARLRGRVESVGPETADSVTVTIRPSRGWPGHQPGQYVRIGIDVDGIRRWRAYSITSSPDGPTFSITVQAMSDGIVSTHIVRSLEPGTLLELAEPAGDFRLPAPTPSRLLFITAGSGITPVMGMLRSHLDELEDVVHVHAASSPETVIFASELRGLHARGRLTLHEHHGRLEADRLDLLVPDLAERETWACGPLGLLDSLEEVYADRGISARLHTERFRTAISTPGEGGTITFERQDIDAHAEPGTTILDAGEAAGALLPSGCRMGICFGCVAPLVSGTVRDLRSGIETSAAPGDDVQIQTCIHAPAGACHIDL